MQARIPGIPVSPAYSLVSTDLGKLGYVLGLIKPGLIFAADARRGVCQGVDAVDLPGKD